MRGSLVVWTAFLQRQRGELGWPVNRLSPTVLDNRLCRLFSSSQLVDLLIRDLRFESSWINHQGKVSSAISAQKTQKCSGLLEEFEDSESGFDTGYSDGGNVKSENFFQKSEREVKLPNCDISKRNLVGGRCQALSKLQEKYLDYLRGICTREFHSTANMAKSKFEYVKQFEVEDRCMPNCWIVIRIDGKSFHRFSDTHHFVKPNDERALGLMSRAAQMVMEDFKDVVLAYGQSDEYSFVFKKDTTMYNRRGSKIMTNLVSLFSSAFVMNWPRYFATQDLQYPPSFDARVVLYPSDQNLKDYLSWRQADCHINNLYNTVFWKLVQERCLTPAQSQERLKGTLSSDKNEILFSEFNINYNNLPEIYRKGTVLIRSREEYETPPRLSTSNSLNHSKSSIRYRSPITILNCDIIGRQFWEDHPEILDPKK